MGVKVGEFQGAPSLGIDFKSDRRSGISVWWIFGCSSVGVGRRVEISVCLAPTVCLARWSDRTAQELGIRSF